MSIHTSGTSEDPSPWIPLRRTLKGGGGRSRRRQALAKKNVELAVANGCSQELAGSDYAASLVTLCSRARLWQKAQSEQGHGSCVRGLVAFLATASSDPLSQDGGYMVSFFTTFECLITPHAYRISRIVRGKSIDESCFVCFGQNYIWKSEPAAWH